MAVAPASASAATLGMLRTTRVPGGRRASSAAIGTPAAIEMTSVWGRTSPPTADSTLSITCGLTASTRMADSRTSW